MAYVAPSNRSTGDLITASIWNADCVANPIALYAGAMSIASQAAYGLPYFASATALAALPNPTTTRKLLMSTNGAAPSYTTETYAAPSTSGNVSTSDGTNWTSAAPVVALANTATLTNKRITKRTGTTASSATPTINTDNVDFYSITAQAEAITSMTTNLSGTPTEGQTLWLAITGTAARAITWGTSFESSTVTLPTTTVTTARLDVGLVWNTVTSKWRCVASA